MNGLHERYGTVFGRAYWKVIMGLLYLIPACAAVTMDYRVGILLFLLPVIIYLSFRHTVLFFCIILAVRPVMDLVADVRLVGPFNLSSIISMYMVFLFMLICVQNEFYFESRIILLFALFIAGALLSMLRSLDILLSVSDAVRYLNLMAMYYLTTYFSKHVPGFENRMLNAVSLSAIIPLGFGLYQFVFQKGMGDINAPNRIFGTFVNPNVFSFYLVIILTVSVLRIIKGKQRLLHVILAAVTIFEIVYTYTRSSWIGILMVFLPALALYRTRAWKKLLTVAGLLLIIALFSGIISSRFENVLEDNREINSLATRFYIWNGMFEFFLESPAIGQGVGNFSVLSAQRLNWGIEAHNDYLRLLVETGIIGLLPYLALLICCLIKGLREYRRKGDPSSLVMTSLFFSFIIMSLADNIIDMTVTQWYVWSLVALAHTPAAEPEGESIESIDGKQVPVS